MLHFSNASLFDRAVLAVSPQLGLNRIKAKARANILMNYDAASNGRRLKGFKAPGTDADAASGTGRRVIRQRSRDLIRNAPFARRAQSVIANNVVGSGITPSLSGANKKAVKKVSDIILPYMASTDLDVHRALNLSSMQTVICNAVFESGEVLVLRRTPLNDHRAIPLAIEVLEVDHLNDSILSYGENEVRDGVEYDETGVAIAYHLYEQHPGSSRRKMSVKTYRVPASDVLHIRRIERPGQMRGVPWLAPVMVTLGELRDYQEAQILKQKISALLAGVVDHGSEEVPSGAGELEDLQPGGLVHTSGGKTVSFTNPPLVNDYDVVMRLGLSAVAMGLGITYESLTGDLSRVNYSSMRAGRLEMDKNIETWQEQILISQFCEGVGQWVLDAYRTTLSHRMNPMQIGWTAQRRALIDPVKEIPAILKKIEGGLSSLSREQRAMGLDPEKIAEERRADAARTDAIAGQLADREARAAGMSALMALMKLIVGSNAADEFEKFTEENMSEDDDERSD